ncbi:MAG TPA: hypothetical protein DCQ98_11835 [Planctomycetaceae bacterium]|nr:hypothetical protein [Planctomycetaceae bacterium]HRE99339.1 DUF1559 domain-containing protein [Pirellulaceae bacterium]
MFGGVGTTFGHRPLRGRTLLGFAALATVLVAGCGKSTPVAGPVEAKPIPAWVEPAGAPAANELDLAFVPPDAIAAILVFPERIASRPWAADGKLIESLRGMAASGGGTLPDLSGCRQVFLAICPSAPGAPPQLVGRAEWSEPVELASLVTSMPNLTPEERKGKSFLTAEEGGVSLHQSAPSTIWFGTSQRLDALLERAPSTGSLARRLRALPLSGDAEFVLDFAPMRGMLESLSLPAAPGMGGAEAMESMRQMLESAESLTATLDSAGDSVASIRFDLGDERQASRMATASREQLAANRSTLTGLLALSNDWPSEARDAADGLIAELLGGIRIESEGTVLKVDVPSQRQGAERLTILAGFASQKLASQIRVGRMQQVAEAVGKWRQAQADAGESAMSTSRLSWRVALLPYLGERKLYDEFRHDEPWDSEHNRALVARIPPVFGSGVEGLTRVRGFAGPGMSLDPSRVGPGTDAAETTLVAAESSAADAVVWTSPDDWTSFGEAELKGAGEASEPTVMVIAADGKLRRIARRVDSSTLSALLSDRGGEMLEADRIFGNLLSRFRIPGLFGGGEPERP